MFKCKKTCKIISVLEKKGCYEKLGTVILFVVFFLYVLFRLMQRGSMIDSSGDAADIWQSIITFYSGDLYPSYVLYKGFAAIFPYVWFYHLAIWLNLNEFFFIMCYHAVLFSYIVVIGIPVLVEALTEYKAKLWQKILLGIVLYRFWGRYYVLSQLMVDLPSCAYFLMAIHCAVLIGRSEKWKRFVLIVVTGLLCGVIANISGQYSISAICIMIFAAVQMWKSSPVSNCTKVNLKKYLPTLFALLLAMFSIRFLKVWFNMTVLDPLAEKGYHIGSGEAWMQRALFYMLDIGRKFYGPDLYDARGNAIVMSIYGEEGKQLLEKAAAGGFGWTIPQYFKAFFKYPVDFIMIYLNRFMVMISDDMGNASLRSLLPSYSMVYLAILTCTKRIKSVKNIFKAKTWLVLGSLASVIPSLVMTVEMRFTISLQALFFGVALVGPIMPKIWQTFYKSVKQYAQDKSILHFAENKFPWEILGWVLFCLICLGYFGLLCGASGMGTTMLYKW